MRRLRKIRPRRWPSFTIGLTGSIAMGKSTAAAFLRHARIPVFNADAAVHGLLGPTGRATSAVAKRFPGVKTAKGIDRQALAALVFGDDRALADLEAIVHPLVHGERERFFRNAALSRRGLIALEIPLLFESKRPGVFDAIMVVSAPSFLQRQRALSRPGMTAARFAKILARQMPDRQKRARADAIIPSGLGKRETLRRLRRSLKVLRKPSQPSAENP
jgi:dephospho-CoA kinase